MSLTVLNVGYPFASVGPNSVGGAEQVLFQLDTALVHQGHRSIVVARAGSQISGTLVQTRAVAELLSDAVRRQIQNEHFHNIQRALDCWHVDLIHMHGVDFFEYAPPPGTPVLVTLHLPRSFYAREVFEMDLPKTFFNCVSQTQARTFPADARFLPCIENGVPIEALSARHAKRRFAISLGRICPEKGFHIACDAAQQAAVPWLLAGEVFPYEAHERYFQNEIRPRLDPQRRFIGAVDFERKRRLLSSARCLLAPSLVDETSSLVAMEALACGTPVIAFHKGALAEIIEPGKTGFLVNNASEMAAAIANAPALDPAVCRAAARERFSLDAMTSKYLRAYETLVNDSAPRAGKFEEALPLVA